ncbi:MAG: hypothetical protein IRZ10_11020 [Thermoflavifilum sp.]|nr:hypothetical protein [Thermoflavifilum sp.]MCL6514938.1 hypothetical protein [Alicyclobacillus sp.]
MDGVLASILAVIAALFDWSRLAPEGVAAKGTWGTLIGLGVLCAFATAYQWWPSIHPLAPLTALFERPTLWLYGSG